MIIKCERPVSGITFTRNAHNQKIGKPDNKNISRSKYTKYFAKEP